MINVKQIAIGFVNATKAQLGIAKEEIESKAIERYSVCLQCEVISDCKQRCDSNRGGVVVKDLTYNNKFHRKGSLNKGCGCYLHLKIRSNDICPLGKW